MSRLLNEVLILALFVLAICALIWAATTENQGAGQPLPAPPAVAKEGT